MSNAMLLLFTGFWQSLFAYIVILAIPVFGYSQVFELTLTYFGQALWCSIVKAAVRSSSKVMTYFSEHPASLRILRKLDPWIALVWCEVTVMSFILRLINFSLSERSPEGDTHGPFLRTRHCVRVSM